MELAFINYEADNQEIGAFLRWLAHILPMG